MTSQLGSDIPWRIEYKSCLNSEPEFCGTERLTDQVMPGSLVDTAKVGDSKISETISTGIFETIIWIISVLHMIVLGLARLIRSSLNVKKAQSRPNYSRNTEYSHWPNGKKQEINSKRRGKLKPAMREAFNTIKYFTELIHPGSVEPKPVRTRFEHQIAQIFKYQWFLNDILGWRK